MESKSIPRREINAGSGAALRLDAEQQVRLINTHGSQVVDTWCLSAADVGDSDVCAKSDQLLDERARS